MVFPTIQPSFAGGELAPALWARVDLAKYAVGLKRCRNFFVHAHGGISNRAGTRFVAEVSDSDHRHRLIPFAFNADQTYVLVFGDETLQVVRLGGMVLTTGDLVYEATSPYAAEDLPLLKFVQSLDVMTITHPDYQARELSRTDHDAWSFDVVTLAPELDAPTGGTLTVGGTEGTTTYEYKVTAVADETLEESLPSAVISTDVGPDTLSTEDYNEIGWTAVTGAKHYNVYKHKNGLYGYVGTSETAGSFRDTNIAPDLTDTPPGSRDPFSGADNYPGAVGYHDQRRAFAMSNNKPATLWTSQSGNYSNFNVSSPLKDDDAITRTLSAGQVRGQMNEIRHIVSMQDLILLTSAAEWKVTGNQDNVLTPAAFNARAQSFSGASHVPPLVIVNRLLFVQDKGAIVRDLGYALETDGYQGSDLSILSGHLFEGHEIEEWAYSQAPYSLVWAVRDDGVLLCLTYQREHEVWAWSWHETDGVIESVCSVSEGQEDAVYLIVRRTIDGDEKRYIERMESRRSTTIENAFFVDCGLTYEGDPASTISGLDHLEGCEVSILADGNVMAARTVSGGSIDLGRPCSVVHVGLPYTADMQTLGVESGRQTIRGRTKRVTKVKLLVENSRGIWAGPDEDNLTELKQRTDEAMGEPIRVRTGLVEVVIDPLWRDEGSIFVQQRDPLPLTISAAMPELELGE